MKHILATTLYTTPALARRCKQPQTVQGWLFWGGERVQSVQIWFCRFDFFFDREDGANSVNSVSTGYANERRILTLTLAHPNNFKLPLSRSTTIAILICECLMFRTKFIHIAKTNIAELTSMRSKSNLTHVDGLLPSERVCVHERAEGRTRWIK